MIASLSGADMAGNKAQYCVLKDLGSVDYFLRTEIVPLIKDIPKQWRVVADGGYMSLECDGRFIKLESYEYLKKFLYNADGSANIASVKSKIQERLGNIRDNYPEYLNPVILSSRLKRSVSC